MAYTSGTTAFITGGGYGLGRALAFAACKRKIKVILADIQASALTQTIQELRAQGSEVSGITVDVADVSTMQRCAEDVF
jgi:NAD(P)-dependent dehydrogenase (short-subunit alcohol dehydrogenase family)